jgi:hypothetical protein
MFVEFLCSGAGSSKQIAISRQWLVTYYILQGCGWCFYVFLFVDLCKIVLCLSRLIRIAQYLLPMVSHLHSPITVKGSGGWLHMLHVDSCFIMFYHALSSCVRHLHHAWLVDSRVPHGK